MLEHPTRFTFGISEHQGGIRLAVTKDGSTEAGELICWRLTVGQAIAFADALLEQIDKASPKPKLEEKPEEKKPKKPPKQATV
jgi:hypothetical protein